VQISILYFVTAPKTREAARTKAIGIINQHNGIIKTKEAIIAGIHPRIVYKLRDDGIIEELTRGVFRLTTMKPISEPDILTVAMRIPNGVFCLISALSYFNITTQIPRKVFIALPKGSETPRINYPPISVHRFSGDSFSQGIQQENIDGIKVNFYCPEKTIMDCFKFRNKIGIDIAIEALKFYKSRYKLDIDKLLKYARICRIENIVKPYLEAVI